MAWIYVRNKKDHFYPEVAMVVKSDGSQEVFGIPRWQTKKWKKADEEIDRFGNGLSLSKKKVFIKWDEYKTLEKRVNKVAYLVLWMIHDTVYDFDPEALELMVKAMTTGERFEVEVDEDFNAHLKCPKDEIDKKDALGELVDKVDANPFADIAYMDFCKIGHDDGVLGDRLTEQALGNLFTALQQED